MAEAGRRAGRVHDRGVSPKQRLHLAALLICAIALPLQGQSDIAFDPAITQQEFEEFSRLVGQAIYTTPVEPAHARGLFGFDIGVAMTAVPVETEAGYWRRAVEDDFTISDYVAVPRIVASKGLGFASVAASYSKVPDSDIQVWGAAVDVPIVEGGVASPTLALRGSWSDLRGVEALDLTTYGVELFLSKGFGPVTPYVAAGRARSDATGRIGDEITLRDQADSNRITLGIKLSLFIPKIVVEATQGEVRSYAAKVSFGL